MKHHTFWPTCFIMLQKEKKTRDALPLLTAPISSLPGPDSDGTAAFGDRFWEGKMGHCPCMCPPATWAAGTCADSWRECSWLPPGLLHLLYFDFLLFPPTAPGCFQNLRIAEVVLQFRMALGPKLDLVCQKTQTPLLEKTILGRFSFCN